MARGTRRDLWGWSLAARRSLAGLVLASTVATGGLSWLSRRALVPDPSLVIDPNTAPPGVLTALPKIGPVLAGRIVAERQVRPFASVDDMDARVRGIGPATAVAIRPHLRFDATNADPRTPLEGPAVAVAARPAPVGP
jgi:competence protein ComEA